MGVTKDNAEKDSDALSIMFPAFRWNTRYLGTAYTQDGKNVLPLGTLTVEETKKLLTAIFLTAYMQARRKRGMIKECTIQITEDGDIAVLSEAMVKT